MTDRLNSLEAACDAGPIVLEGYVSRRGAETQRTTKMRFMGRTCCAGCFGAIGVAFVFLTLTCARPDSADVRQTAREGDASTARYVVALGNIVANEAPSESEVRLAEFLFGAPPEAPIGVLKPAGLAASGEQVFIGDAALAAVFAWNGARREMTELRLSRDLRQPVSIFATENGDLFVVDAAADVVRRFDSTRRETMRYAPMDASMTAGAAGSRGSGPGVEARDFIPADALVVGNRLWVTNVAMHRIDQFELSSGRLLRSIGERGRGPGQFGMPLGMAHMPNERVAVVDMLNARVQVLTHDGDCRQIIGGPGDRVGRFGRPKDVAVGPDGVIFVLDAALQRVHAFAPDGRALLSFGGPRAGRHALSVPASIAIAPAAPVAANMDAIGFTPAYYVLVAEQVRDPGVRAYAWSGEALAEVPPPRRGPAARAASTESPHWKADRCGDCHAMDGGRTAKIAASDVDRLCLSCHDGKKAVAEAHPINRPGQSDLVATPADWPLLDGRLSCLTCHDMIRHCDTAAARPEVNSTLLRGALSDNPLDFCANCHKPDDSWRLSPHQQVLEDGQVRTASCGFCHVETPTRPKDGARSGYAYLRTASSDVCLSCHVRHWDYSPEGHVDRPAPGKVRAALGIEGLLRPEPREGGPTTEGALPLSHGNVTCFSCHNPHDEKLFAADTELGMRATTGEDARVDLRMNRTELCLSCHRW